MADTPTSMQDLLSNTLLDGTPLSQEMIDNVLSFIPLTTLDYVDKCLPTPKSGYKERCENYNMLDELIDLPQVIEKSQRIASDICREAYYKSVLPIIYYAIENHKKNSENVRASEKQTDFLMKINNIRGFRVDKKMIKLALENNNKRFVDIFFRAPHIPLIIRIRDELIRDHQMEGIMQKMLENKSYHLLWSLSHRLHYINQDLIPITFLIMDMFSNEQKKIILTLPVEIIPNDMEWDENVIVDENLEQLSQFDDRTIFFGHISLNHNDFFPNSNYSVLIMRYWDYFIHGISAAGTHHWSPSYEMVAQMIQNSDISDESIKWTFIVILYICNIDLHDQFHIQGVEPHPIGNQIHLLFGLIIDRIHNFTADDMKARIAEYFHTLFLTYINLRPNYQLITADTIIKYNNIVGQNPMNI